MSDPPKSHITVNIHAAVQRLAKGKRRPLLTQMKERVAARLAARKSELESMTEENLLQRISQIKMAAIERKARYIVQAIASNSMTDYDIANTTEWLWYINKYNCDHDFIEEGQKRNVDLDQIPPDAATYQQTQEDTYLLEFFE